MVAEAGTGAIFYAATADTAAAGGHCVVQHVERLAEKRARLLLLQAADLFNIFIYFVAKYSIIF